MSIASISPRLDRLAKGFLEWARMGLQPVAREERPATKTAALCFSGGSDQRFQVWRRR